MPRRLDKDMRIGIVGAGPAGLSAAEALKELGYENVVVFERQKRVGGQSLSATYRTSDGRDLVYELGSLQPISSANLYRLFQRYGIHVGKSNQKDNPGEVVQRIKIRSLDGRNEIADFTRYPLGFPLSFALLSDALKFGFYLFRYRELRKPGYQVSPALREELSDSVVEWTGKRGFKVLDLPLKMMASLGAMGNYQLKDEFPAYTFFKGVWQNLQWPLTRVTYLNGVVRQVAEGYQELWNRVAKQHDVRLNVTIVNVVRREDEVEVTLADDRTVALDRLIIACSLTQAAKFLDLAAEEEQLFSQVRYNPGWRVGFVAKNAPHDAAYFMLEPFLQNYHGLPLLVAEGKVDDSTWVYSSAVPSAKNDSIEPLLREAETFLKQHFDGEILQWLKQVYWSEYHPHFSKEAFTGGIYERLEGLQGKRNTYYLGEALSGSMHGTVVDYSYKRIDEFFGVH